MNDLYIDGLAGAEFEGYLSNLFSNLGYDVEHTPASNDYGADLIVSKNAERTVVQAKRYSSSVGISAIQEIIGAKKYYDANKCLVVTNNYFTPNAIELAQSNNVELWDRDTLIHMITLSLNKGELNKISQKQIQFQEILDSDEYKKNNSKIPLILGQTLDKKIIVTSIDKMPHLLIAGATGTGKSMYLHMLICGILNKSTQNDVKLLLIDPKMVELSIYNEIPHLLIPVITDVNKAVAALNWMVQEMLNRYKLFTRYNVRDINSYNNRIREDEKYSLPIIVIIIDELANLVTTNTYEITDLLNKLTQMGRTTGIYLIATTSIPSIANTFKNNFPSRIAFRVFSQSDSKLIIDNIGAEKLSEKGDMLFYPIGELKPIRVQGAFIKEEEIINMNNSFKQCVYVYNNDSIKNIQNIKEIELNDTDELFDDALKIVLENQQASISLLQRRLKIGYNRAARIIDEMEVKGVIGPYDGSNPRQVLLNVEILNELKSDYSDNIKDKFNNKYDVLHKSNKKSKIFKRTISFLILIFIANFTIVNIDNPAIGFPLLFLIIIFSFKLGSFITSKIFK